MSDAENDRRREARAPIELKVEYKRLNTFFYDYTKNISKGGTFIKTEKPLGIGTIFLFKLVIPAQAEPLALRGEVRWIVKEGEPLPPQAPPGHEPGMGIKFVYDSADQRRDLEALRRQDDGRQPRSAHLLEPRQARRRRRVAGRNGVSGLHALPPPPRGLRPRPSSPMIIVSRSPPGGRGPGEAARRARPRRARAAARP